MYRTFTNFEYGSALVSKPADFSRFSTRASMMRDQVALGNEPAASRLQIKPRRSSKAQCNDKVLKKILNVGTSVLQNLFYYIF